MSYFVSPKPSNAVVHITAIRPSCWYDRTFRKFDEHGETINSERESRGRPEIRLSSLEFDICDLSVGFNTLSDGEQRCRNNSVPAVQLYEGFLSLRLEFVFSIVHAGVGSKYVFRRLNSTFVTCLLVLALYLTESNAAEIIQRERESCGWRHTCPGFSLTCEAEVRFLKHPPRT
jgi:hypothetical protein